MKTVFVVLALVLLSSCKPLCPLVKDQQTIKGSICRFLDPVDAGVKAPGDAGSVVSAPAAVAAPEAPKASSDAGQAKPGAQAPAASDAGIAKPAKPEAPESGQSMVKDAA